MGILKGKVGKLTKMGRNTLDLFKMAGDMEKVMELSSNASVDGVVSGLYRDSEGNVYDGEFLEGVCQGVGTKTWTFGRTYKGEWKHNKADGMGEESIPQEGDFLFYSGEFVDGKR